ncbi:hypothetical protein TorRG33x02_343450 [Trema orientale]|uniref:Uncharacterized protein n=1 Tax=Trema orientale TaxID=63057 RepID=A0A2P5ARG0_TREOI|nr:hypothetical protein TorRG33x02_343450 [Trema orientale]
MTNIQFGSVALFSSIAEWNIECLVRSSKKVDFSLVRESRQEVMISTSLLYYTFQLQLLLGEK